MIIEFTIIDPILRHETKTFHVACDNSDCWNESRSDASRLRAATNAMVDGFVVYTDVMGYVQHRCPSCDAAYQRGHDSRSAHETEVARRRSAFEDAYIAARSKL